MSRACTSEYFKTPFESATRSRDTKYRERIRVVTDEYSKPGAPEKTRSVLEGFAYSYVDRDTKYCERIHAVTDEHSNK